MPNVIETARLSVSAAAGLEPVASHHHVSSLKITRCCYLPRKHAITGAVAIVACLLRVFLWQGFLTTGLGCLVIYGMKVGLKKTGLYDGEMHAMRLSSM